MLTKLITILAAHIATTPSTSDVFEDYCTKKHGFEQYIGMTKLQYLECDRFNSFSDLSQITNSANQSLFSSIEIHRIELIPFRKIILDNTTDLTNIADLVYGGHMYDSSHLKYIVFKNILGFDSTTSPDREQTSWKAK